MTESITALVIIFAVLIGYKKAALTGALIGLGLGLLAAYFVQSEKRKHANKALGVVLGFMFAGPLGAIAGAYLGFTVDMLQEGGGPKEPPDPRTIFEINWLAILSYVIKSDGIIQKEEVESALLASGFDKEHTEKLMVVMAIALGQNIDLEGTCRNFCKVAPYEERLILLSAVCRVVMADGIIHDHEKQAIEDIIQFLGIKPEDGLSIKAEFLRDKYRHFYKPKPEEAYEEHYAILGVKEGAGLHEVKKAYRRMALKYHPDRVSHLGKEYVQMAEGRLQKINDAYNKIRKKLVKPLSKDS